MKPLKVTGGEWKVRTTSETNHSTLFIYSEGRGAICKIPDRFKALNEHEDNAKLIVDAGNTHNKCRILPSELLDLLKESMVHLKRYAELIPDSKEWDGRAQSLDNYISKIETLKNI